MKSLFSRREKYLYRRNSLYASFISGTKFGVVVAVLLLVVIKLG